MNLYIIFQRNFDSLELYCHTLVTAEIVLNLLKDKGMFVCGLNGYPKTGNERFP